MYTDANTRRHLKWGLKYNDLFEVNISANKISLLQGQSYTEREYYNGSSSLNSNFTIRYSVPLE